MRPQNQRTHLDAPEPLRSRMQDHMAAQHTYWVSIAKRRDNPTEENIAAAYDAYQAERRAVAEVEAAEREVYGVTSGAERDASGGADSGERSAELGGAVQRVAAGAACGG